MNIEVTNFQKAIYNSYLYTVRKAQNKPIKLRKNFNDIKEDTHRHLMRLENFFKRFSNIDMDVFFSAPFNIYQEKSHLKLEYFLKRQALKDYQIYRRQLIFDTPDSEYNLKSIIKSLKFLKNFLNEKNMSVNDYLKIKSNNYLPDFVMHLKDDKISFYILFGFDNFAEEFSKILKEDKVLLFSKTYLNWISLRNKFYMSKKAKILVREGLKKIDSTT